MFILWLLLRHPLLSLLKDLLIYVYIHYDIFPLCFDISANTIAGRFSMAGSCEQYSYAYSKFFTYRPLTGLITAIRGFKHLLSSLFASTFASRAVSSTKNAFSNSKSFQNKFIEQLIRFKFCKLCPDPGAFFNITSVEPNVNVLQLKRTWTARKWPFLWFVLIR